MLPVSLSLVVGLTNPQDALGVYVPQGQTKIAQPFQGWVEGRNVTSKSRQGRQKGRLYRPALGDTATAENPPEHRRLSRCKDLGLAPTLSFQVTLHVLHSVLLQEHLQFLPKRHSAMMFRLTLDVLRGFFDAGN